MRRAGILLLVFGLSACNFFSPPSPPLPDADPTVLPGAVTPTARPTRSPGAQAVRPSAAPSPTPTPSATSTNGCPTPPPGVCCGVIFGSIQGTVTGPDGQTPSGVQVVARSTNGAQMGNCSDGTASPVVNGRYAFNAVPFGMTVTMTATAPGYQAFSTTLTLPKGPIYVQDIQMKRSS